MNYDFLFALDAPPSYEQLFGVGQMKRQMQEAKQDSSNRGVFAAKVCEIFCGSSKSLYYIISAQGYIHVCSPYYNYIY